MRNLKKVLSLALAMVMLIGMMVVGAGAVVTDFRDDADINADNKEAVLVMSELSILEGYDDGSFHADGTLNRAEAAKILAYVHAGATIADALSKTQTKFTDVPADEWYSGFVAYCYNMDIIAGSSATTFDPQGTLTAMQFAKMLLVAMGGDSTKYVGDAWATNTMRDAITAGLNEKARVTDWNAPITRDQASQMAFNGLTGTLEGNKTYIVTSSSGKELYKGDDYEIAKLILATNTNTGAKLTTEKTAEGTLGLKNYQLESKDVEDGFGHMVKAWVTNKGKSNEETLCISEEPNTAADIVIKNQVEDSAKTIETKTLKGVKIDTTNGIKPLVDNKEVTAVKSLGAIAALCQDNNVVEIYLDADKNVSQIIVVNTYAGKVTVTEANEKKETKRSINIQGATNLNSLETEDFEKDDIVLYTKSANGTKYDIKNVVLADSFDGELTSFTNKAPVKYTISGSTYELASAGLLGTFDADTLKAIATGTYYLGVSGKIVYAEGEKTDTNTGDYAVILDAKITKKDAAWPKTGIEVTLQVNALLADGTMGIYTVANKVTIDTKSNPVTAKMDLKGETDDKVDLLTNEGAAVEDAASLFTGVYDYSLDDDKITLNSKVATLTGSETSGVVADSAKNNTAYNISSSAVTLTPNTGSKKAIINNKTVFVMKSADGKSGKMVTGAVALEDTVLKAENIKAVMSVASNGDLTAKVVFATDKFTAKVTDTGEYAYLDGDYSRSAGKDSDGKYTYTFNAINSEGEQVELTLKKSETSIKMDAGIYAIKDDGSVGDLKTDKKVKVTTYSEGILVTDTGDVFTVSDDAKIVIAEDGAELKTDAQVYVVANSKTTTQADIIFVLNAAD